MMRKLTIDLTKYPHLEASYYCRALSLQQQGAYSLKDELAEYERELAEHAQRIETDPGLPEKLQELQKRASALRRSFDLNSRMLENVESHLDCFAPNFVVSLQGRVRRAERELLELISKIHWEAYFLGLAVVTCQRGGDFLIQVVGRVGK